jgi:hypothetical protein
MAELRLGSGTAHAYDAGAVVYLELADENLATLLTDAAHLYTVQTIYLSSVLYAQMQTALSYAIQNYYHS